MLREIPQCPDIHSQDSDLFVGHSGEERGWKLGWY